MPSKLPKGWSAAKLADVCLPVAHIQPGDFPETDFTYFDIGGIDNHRNVIAETKTVTGQDAPSRARQVVQKNDVLFSTVRTYLRNVARIEADYENAIASTGFAVIRAADGVRPQFLFYQLISEEFLAALNPLQTGTSYPAVRARDVFAQNIRVAPTREQSRIVPKLEELLQGVERGQQAIQRASDRLKRYRLAVLQSAATGELTGKWRHAHNVRETAAQLVDRMLKTRRRRWEEAELIRLNKAGKKPGNQAWKNRYPEARDPDISNLPELPEGWAWATIEQLAAHEPKSITDGPFGSNLKTEHYTKSGPRVVRLQNIGDAVFIDDRAHISQARFRKLKAYAVEAGDLVIRALGTPAPRACRIPEWLGPAIVKADCIRFNVAEKFVDPQYVLYALNAPPTQRRTGMKIHGIGRPRLNLGEIKGIALPLPPYEEQKQIVREVKHRLSAADQLNRRLDRGQQHAQTQRQSVLRDAFAGKVVQQDPNDEPASALLERIERNREKSVKDSEVQAMKRPTARKTRGMHRPSVRDILAKHPRGLSPEALFKVAGFKPFEVDMFYRELTSLRDILEEIRPGAEKIKAWPLRATVVLKLKRS